MGISIWQLLIIFAIIILLFGTKKLRSLGGDLGSAVKGFKNAVKDDQKPDAEFSQQIEQQDSKTESASEKQSSSNKVD